MALSTGNGLRLAERIPKGKAMETKHTEKMHPIKRRKISSYYASQSPRGFANEVIAHKFASRAARDQWVDEHRSDGDCNSATRGASACTAAQARKIVGYRGDAVTESYNSMVEHTGAAGE